jgi:hypothetical protein
VTALRVRSLETNLVYHALSTDLGQSVRSLLVELLLDPHRRVVEDLDHLGRSVAQIPRQHDLLPHAKLGRELGPVAEDDERVGGGDGELARPGRGHVLRTRDGDFGYPR